MKGPAPRSLLLQLNLPGALDDPNRLSEAAGKAVAVFFSAAGDRSAARQVRLQIKTGALVDGDGTDATGRTIQGT